MMLVTRFPAIAALACLLAACGGDDVPPVDGGVDAGPVCVPDTDELDLLLVIENAGNVGEELASLTEDLPRLLTVLTTGDRDGDGTPDFDPVRALQVGVVTSDMGTGGVDIPPCTGGAFGSDFGDDGVLRTRGATSVTSCEASYPSVLAFAADAGEDLDAFTAELACLTLGVGTDGCGYEQPLEALLKALSPSVPTAWTAPGYAAPRFFRDTFGHGDGANAGFVREGSVLAVLLLAIEDDCSASDLALFDPAAEAYQSVDLSMRCFAFPEAQHPVDRYVGGEGGHAGLLGLRREPANLVFGVLAGVPVDAIEDPSRPDYDAILEHPLMQETVDPTMPTRLVPSCNVPGRGLAFPPRRIVDTARGLEQAGAGTVVGSVCQESYAGPIDAFVARIADALTRPECP